MVVNGTNDSYLDELNSVLGINSDDIVSFKVFLQSVENMNLKIDGLKTYISKTGDEHADCLGW
jgi:indole-3-glycerol phosphate synthase